jgi:hypothetical protein
MAMRFLAALPLFWFARLAAAADAAAVVEPTVLEKYVRVPDDYATIQAAVDAAPDGGTVLIAPGVYHEGIRIAGKSVYLASHYLIDHDPKLIASTILDGSVPPEPDAEDDDDGVRDAVIDVAEDAGPKTTILGLTIREGDDGITCHARIRILFNRFVNNDDAIDYEDGGGECRFNVFVANDDDAVDYDGACDGLCANNEIRDNDDDGIEIRLQPYQGEKVHIVIRDNVITGNGEDGIQIIDYPGLSDRTITIERNVIAGNAMAGIGCMADANSRENYQGALIPEPIAIVNNTIAGNQYGITGGANARVVNNIISGHRFSALKNIAGRSTISHNIVWENGAEPVDSNLVERSLLSFDPLLETDYRPRPGSPCIDAGVVRLDMEGATAVAPCYFRGRAPDLGALEVE